MPFEGRGDELSEQAMTQWFLLKTTVYFSVCPPGLLTRSPFIATKQICVSVCLRERRSKGGESMSGHYVPFLDSRKCIIYVDIWITLACYTPGLCVPHCVNKHV